MSVLEFISSLKWPIVVLVGIFVVSRGFKRNPDMGRWFRRWLDSRDVRGKIGPTEFEATASQAQAAAQVAAASDDELASSLVDGAAEVPSNERSGVATMRREAVESAMQNAARMGWLVAHAGMADLPNLTIKWSEQGVPQMEGRLPPGAWERFAAAQGLARGQRISWSEMRARLGEQRQSSTGSDES